MIMKSVCLETNKIALFWLKEKLNFVFQNRFWLEHQNVVGIEFCNGTTNRLIEILLLLQCQYCWGFVTQNQTRNKFFKPKKNNWLCVDINICKAGLYSKKKYWFDKEYFEYLIMSTHLIVWREFRKLVPQLFSRNWGSELVNQ